jgi:hypothetical protein
MKYLIVILFLLLYLLLPTQNSTVDAYYYAASVKFGRDLFLPHHLLYNAAGFAIARLVAFFNITPDVLALLKTLNALAAGAGLLVLSKILKHLQVNKNQIPAYLLVAGSCFGYWRFATENETYIFPIVLSLLGSYFFLRMLHEERVVFAWLAGFMAALACLFHQIHFFWWLGLLAGISGLQKKRHWSVFYATPALLVPLAYALVLLFTKPGSLSVSGYFQFVFEDFFKGRVEQHIGLKHFVLTPINFIRSFLQVHGNLFFLIRKNLVWALPALVAVILLVLALLRLKIKRVPFNNLKIQFARTHVLIFVLHLLFAFYAMGNAEFMVMLPVLLLLIVNCLAHIPKKALYLTGVAFMVWNLAYGIIPNYFYRYTNYQQLFGLIQQNPESLFILADDVTVTNKLYYQTGQEDWPQVHRSPAIMALKQIPLAELHLTIGQYQQDSRKVFTDCANYPAAVNRASLLQGTENQAFFRNYLLSEAGTSPTLYGPYRIHQVSQKSQPGLKEKNK